MTTTLICPCTFVDGKVYPDPNQECPNGHVRGQSVDPLVPECTGGYACPSRDHVEGCLSGDTPPRRRRRTKTAVYPLNEGGFMVRGTDDPTEALRIAVDGLPDGDYYNLDEVVAGIARDAYDTTLTDEDKALNAADAAHFFKNRLDPQNHRAGLLRISPCHCGDHGWHWDTAKAPGHGVFKGVVFE